MPKKKRSIDRIVTVGNLIFSYILKEAADWRREERQSAISPC